MSARSPDFPDDRTGPERRKTLTEQEIKDLELAGGVEGGMRAGSAGGTGANDKAEATDAEDRAEQAKPARD
jgi:hypothetical protein